MQLFLDIVPMIFLLGSILIADMVPEKWGKISIVLWIAYGLFGLTLFMKNDKADELSEKVLGKVDKRCMDIVKITLFILILVVCIPYSNRDLPLNRDVVLIAICAMLTGFTMLRAILFSYYEKKGY